MTKPFAPLPFTPDKLDSDLSFETTVNMLDEAFASYRAQWAEHATIGKNDAMVKYDDEKTQFKRIRHNKEAIVKYYRDLGWRTVRIFEERHFNSYNVIFVELKR
jgi:hypothetical protein